MSEPSPPPDSTLFPYTTLFRSRRRSAHRAMFLRWESFSFSLFSGEKARRFSWIWMTRLIRDRKSTRLNSSHVASSYAVFCLKKKTDPLRGADHRRQGLALSQVG